MMTDKPRYSLQLCPLELNESEDGVSEMEIVAQPEGPGQAIRRRSRQWLPVFERLCTFLSSSPFHRKLMHRTLKAGVPMRVVDRTDGSTHYFSHEEIAALAFDEPGAA